MYMYKFGVLSTFEMKIITKNVHLSYYDLNRCFFSFFYVSYASVNLISAIILLSD